MSTLHHYLCSRCRGHGSVPAGEDCCPDCEGTGLSVEGDEKAHELLREGWGYGEAVESLRHYARERTVKDECPECHELRYTDGTGCGCLWPDPDMAERRSLDAVAADAVAAGESTTVHAVCPECAGTGELLDYDDFYWVCLACHGTGQLVPEEGSA